MCMHSGHEATRLTSGDAQVGKTDEEGTDPQGGCGVLGYKASADGTPVITHTNAQITLECMSSGHAFRIVTTVA